MFTLDLSVNEVQHIQTGRHRTFDTMEEMLDFLRRQAEDPEVLTK